ncbi:MAG: hypothetical protein AAF481_11210 [Acidobacteriota bacterium]
MSSVVAVALFAAVLPGSISADGERVAFSEDPDQVVLQFFVTGSYRADDVLFTVYGDGRLVYQKFLLTINQVIEEKRVQIGWDGVDQLLQIYAVDYNLLDCGTGCIGSKVRASLGIEKLPRSSDGSEVLIRFDILVDRGHGLGALPLQKEVRLHSAGMLSRICPEVRELQGIQELRKSLLEYANEGGAK